MIEAVITIRNAREGDAEGIAEVHDTPLGAMPIAALFPAVSLNG